jgi:hypothetical protein
MNPGHSIFENTVSIESLPQGDTGVYRTLEAMAQAVRGELAPDYVGWQNERLGGEARRIVVGMHDFESVCQRLFTYVRDVIPYRRDPPDTQIVQDVPATLGWRDGQPGGKCVDKVVTLAALLRSLGYVSRFIVQRHEQSGGSRDFDHVYLEAENPQTGEWVALDPTGDGIGEHPLFQVGDRNPAIEEVHYPIFGDSMAYGLGDTFNWGDTIEGWGNRGLDVLGAWSSRSPYISPDDPRYRELQRMGYAPPYYEGTHYPGLNQPSANVSQFGTQFNIPFWGWALIGVVAGSYFLGKGRR